MNPLLLTFGVVITTAPAAYDYAGVVPHSHPPIVNDDLPENIHYALGLLLREGKPVRVLLVPQHTLQSQADRYSSGSYFTHILEVKP